METLALKFPVGDRNAGGNQHDHDGDDALNDRPRGKAPATSVAREPGKSFNVLGNPALTSFSLIECVSLGRLSLSQVKAE